MSNRKASESTTQPTAATVSGMPRIMVVDDHPVMCEGLVRLINDTNEFRSCAQANTISDAWNLVESTRPDLLILDITLGNQNAMELIKDLKQHRPELPVLVHSIHEEQVYAQRAIRAGARGYVMKNEPIDTLLNAIRRVLSGEVHLSDHMTRRLLHRIAGDSSAHENAYTLNHLTDRELEVFQRLGRGQKTSEIARDLHLSIKTIQTYCAHLKEKLGIRDAAQLVRFAVQWNADRG